MKKQEEAEKKAAAEKKAKEEAEKKAAADKKAKEEAEKKAAVDKKAKEEAEKKAKNSFLYSLMSAMGTGEAGPESLSLNERFFLAQFDTIKKIAEKYDVLNTTILDYADQVK